MIEKILARKAGTGLGFSIATSSSVAVDMTVLSETCSFAVQWMRPNRIHDSRQLAVVMDHRCRRPQPSETGGRARWPAIFVATLASNASYDVGQHGILPSVIPRTGLARPGRCWPSPILTCAAGAYNTAVAFGAGRRFFIMCIGNTWFPSAPDIRL